MLAYVFWHWKADSIPAEPYEALARDFHMALRAAPPPGFRGSFAFAIEGAAWIPDGRAAYEDWYLLDSSAALDSLDRAAVAPPRQDPHDAIARAVADGAGGLYRLYAGAPLPDATHALWFRKPAGMSYAALGAALAPLTSAGTAIWCRQMVLGPAPEFCVHSRGAVEPPPPVRAARLALRALPL